jgi:cell division protein ZapA
VYKDGGSDRHAPRHLPIARFVQQAENEPAQLPWRTPLKIDIYDQSYNVNAEQDEAYVRELAAYVDGRMREVSDATRMVDSLKVAVLAALNIADELFTLRRRQERIQGPLRKRIENCVGLVEKALEHS